MINFYDQKNKNVNSALDEKPNSTIEAGLEEKSNISKYVDPTGEFSSKQFNFSIFYLKNKIIFYRIAVGLLSSIIIVTFSFSLWQTYRMLTFEITGKKRIEQELTHFINYTALRSYFSPLPLEVLSTQMLSSGVNKIDALAEFFNPNPKHIIYFDYYFNFGENNTEKKKGVLLPGETQLFAVFGLEEDVFRGYGNLLIENLRFLRLSAHKIPDANLWQAERMNFSIKDFTYNYMGEEGAHAHALHFTLINNSAFSYKKVNFTLGLYHNSSLVGVMPLVLENFESGESRKLDLRNFTYNLLVSEIRVFPMIDLLDKGVYLPPRGQIQY